MEKVKIEKLTPEQESKIPVYRDLYINKFFKNDHKPEFAELKDYFSWAYKEFELSDSDPHVLIFDSPLELLKAKVILEHLLEGLEVVDKQDKIVDYTNYTGNKILDEILVQLSKQFNFKVTDSLLKDVLQKDLSPVYEIPCYYFSAFNSWVSFYSFFDKEVIEGGLDISEKFNKYAKILDFNIFWTLTFENFVFVSRNATFFSRNDLGEIHNVNGPGIEFKDGYKLYYIKGLNVSEELYLSLENDTYTFSDWVSESNEEIKSVVLAYIEEKRGSSALANFLSENLTEVDTYVDKKGEEFLVGTTGGMNVGVYTLFKGKINEDIELGFVRCYCPSTDRMFFLSVEPSQENAKDAIASLYRIPRKLVSEIKYIQRQGERFSTVLTNTGNEIVKKLSKEELADLVPIDGEKYFSMMRYEY